MKRLSIFNLSSVLKLTFLLGLTLFISSCDNEDDPPEPQNIVDIVVANDDFDILEAAVIRANLSGTLSGAGPFTVFAPTDAAFESAGITESVVNSMDPSELSMILTYHVLSGEFLSSSLSSGTQPTLLTDASVEITVSGSSVQVNDANVVDPDVETSNGVIHVIDGVLMPPVPGLVDAATDAGLSSLLAAIQSVDGLLNTLTSADNLTIFAPTDQAFTDFLNAIGKDLTDIPEDVLATVLQYHVIAASSGPIASSDLQASQTVSTLATEDVTITSNGGVFVDPDGTNAEVTTADVETENGIVHVIDKVLVPPSMAPIVGTIVAPAYFDKQFTTLIAAVNAADPSILTTLLGNGPSDNGLTLFAPTNAAFEAAGITDLSAVTDVEGVLTYHLLDGTVASGDISAGGVTTVNGESIYLSIVDSDVFINGKIQVTTPDVTGSNGVVHIIDETLLPPTQNIAEIVTTVADGGNGEFTTLLSLISAAANLESGASVADVLASDGPYTVFAPTDAAFEKIPQATLDALSAEQIRDILLYHVVPAAVFSTDLSSGAVTTALGTDITIDAENLTITDFVDAEANIVPGENGELINILGTNGVIHTIDNVLLPINP